MNEHLGRQKTIAALVAASLIFAAGCKDESAPKAPEKNEDKKPGSSDPGQQEPVVHDPPETVNGGAIDQNPAVDRDCSVSTQPEWSSSAGSGTQINVIPGSSVNWTFEARDRDCTFEVFRIEATNLPAGLSVVANDSHQVSVNGTTAGGTSTGSGSLTVYARNVTACKNSAAAEEAQCRTYEGRSGQTDSYDVRTTFSWAFSGSVGGSGGSADNSGLVLRIGLGLMSALLGGSNPLSSLGPLTGTNLPGGGMNGDLGGQLFPGTNTNASGGAMSCNGLQEYQCRQSGCYWNGNFCVRSGSQTGQQGQVSCEGLTDYQCQQQSGVCRWDGFSCIRL